MKIIPLLLLGAALLLPTTVQAATVTVTGGQVSGVNRQGIESFKGIPFAAPPVGDLRWRAPQPAPAWEGVRKADHFGPDCMQEPFPQDDAPLTTKPSEDCLYLNVWRPAGMRAGALPVIVWIYGGGFVNGGTSPNIYDGSAFARDGVIFVSFNYRLGRFGFFGHPALSAANADNGLLGNYGYMDQIAALKWVQANIAAFGGDPARVTVFGESAGGSSVHMLLTSPLAQGLFARAIIESSGGGRNSPTPPRLLGQDQPDVPSLQTLGMGFAAKNGITGSGPEALAALRALPAEAVTAGLGMHTRAQALDTYGGPIIDGVIVREPAPDAYLAGRAARVPVIVGANSADSGNLNVKSRDEAYATFGALADQARAAYDPDGAEILDRIAGEMGRDRAQLEPARFTARTLAAQTTYQYRFSYTALAIRQRASFGAPHASEIPYVMDTVHDRYGIETMPGDMEMARQMHGYWVNFAKTGNPNGPRLPAWPAYDPAQDVLLDFTRYGQAAAIVDPLKPRLDVTEALMQKK